MAVYVWLYNTKVLHDQESGFPGGRENHMQKIKHMVKIRDGQKHVVGFKCLPLLVPKT